MASFREITEGVLLMHMRENAKNILRNEIYDLTQKIIDTNMEIGKHQERLDDFPDDINNVMIDIELDSLKNYLRLLHHQRCRAYNLYMC